MTLDFITLQRPSAVRLMLEEALARSGRQLDVALESHQLVTVGGWWPAAWGQRGAGAV